MSAHTVGVFVDYRATHNFHLGAVDGLEVYKDDIVQYDGTTIKVGGTPYQIPAIKGAIKNNWLVIASDTTTTYASSHAPINVSGATNTARDRGTTFDSRTRNDEESDLGTISKVRDRGDGTVKRASVISESGEGVAVGTIKTPARQNFSVTNENVQSLTQQQRRLDSTEGSSGSLVVPIRSARVIERDQDIYGDEDSVVVGKAPAFAKSNPMSEDEPYLSSNEKANRKAASVEAERQARIAASTPPSADTGSDIPADLAQKVALVRAVIPNFSWDMTRPWKSRVAEALRTYSKNPIYLNGILAVESDTVKNQITKQMQSK